MLEKGSFMIKPKLLIQTPEEFRQALDDYMVKSNDFMVFYYAKKLNVPEDGLKDFAINEYVKCMTGKQSHTVGDPIHDMFKTDDKSRFGAALRKREEGCPVEFWGKTSNFEHITTYKVRGETPEEIYVSLKESYDKFWDLLEKFDDLQRI